MNNIISQELYGEIGYKLNSISQETLIAYIIFIICIGLIYILKGEFLKKFPPL